MRRHATPPEPLYNCAFCDFGGTESCGRCRPEALVLTRAELDQIAAAAAGRCPNCELPAHTDHCGLLDVLLAIRADLAARGVVAGPGILAVIDAEDW